MRRVTTIVFGALRMWYRSKSTLFWTLAFPIFMMLLFGAIFSVSQNPTFDLYVQNQDIISGEPTLLSKTFFRYRSFVRYCQNNDLNYISDLENFDFKSLKDHKFNGDQIAKLETKYDEYVKLKKK